MPDTETVTTQPPQQASEVADDAPCAGAPLVAASTGDNGQTSSTVASTYGIPKSKKKRTKVVVVFATAATPNSTKNEEEHHQMPRLLVA